VDGHAAHLESLARNVIFSGRVSGVVRAADAQPVEREEVGLEGRRDGLVLGVVVGLEVRVRERLLDGDALCRGQLSP